MKRLAFLFISICLISVCSSKQLLKIWLKNGTTYVVDLEDGPSVNIISGNVTTSSASSYLAFPFDKVKKLTFIHDAPEDTPTSSEEIYSSEYSDPDGHIMVNLQNDRQEYINLSQFVNLYTNKFDENYDMQDEFVNLVINLMEEDKNYRLKDVISIDFVEKKNRIDSIDTIFPHRVEKEDTIIRRKKKQKAEEDSLIITSTTGQSSSTLHSSTTDEPTIDESGTGLSSSTWHSSTKDKSSTKDQSSTEGQSSTTVPSSTTMTSSDAELSSSDVCEIHDADTLICPNGLHPHAIDLGLPSGTLWCCSNVGAKEPTEYGEYFAWGETEPKKVYNYLTYIPKTVTTNEYGDEIIKWDLTDENISGTSHDAAHVRMGERWCMPSMEQINELRKYCKAKTAKWVVREVEITKNCDGSIKVDAGKQIGEEHSPGMLLIGPNGNIIFLPLPGYYAEGRNSGVDKIANYWSGDPTNAQAGCWGDNKNLVNILFMNYQKSADACGWGEGRERVYQGCSIRPVFK